MDILLCTKSNGVKAFFTPLDRGKKNSLTVVSPEELPSLLKKLSGQYLVYLDISAFENGEWEKHLKALGKNEDIRSGIVDPKQNITDPSALFHAGAVDYIPRSLLSEGYTPKRLKAVLDFDPFKNTGNHQNHTVLNKQNWKILPKGWTGIQSGKEYTFFFLYVELNMLDEWKKSGSKHIDSIYEIFHRHIENTFKPYGGRIWMWMNNVGVVLFPFDGERCPCIEPCLRLVLNRRIITIEEYRYDTLITYTMAVHLGNTVYKTRGQTGEIISDSVNFLFHVGKKLAEKERFYISETVLPFLCTPIADLYRENGTFEGVKMYSMKLPKR